MYMSKTVSSAINFLIVRIQTTSQAITKLNLIFIYINKPAVFYPIMLGVSGTNPQLLL